MDSSKSNKIGELIRQLDVDSPEVQKLLSHLEDITRNACSFSQEKDKETKDISISNSSQPHATLNVPSYAQIFHPPEKSDREPGKLYGREYLRVFYPDQNRVLTKNYGMVREWFKKEKRVDDLRHNKDGKEWIQSIIQKNYEELKPLTFRVSKSATTTYNWKEKDVYNWYVRSSQSKRKNEKKGPSKSDSSSSLTKMRILNANSKAINDMEKSSSQNDIESLSGSLKVTLHHDESNNKSDKEVVYKPDLSSLDYNNIDKENDKDNINDNEDGSDIDENLHGVNKKTFQELLCTPCLPQVTPKFQSHLEDRQIIVPTSSKSKRHKGNSSLEDATSLNETTGTQLATQYTKVDQETILMRYLGAKTIEEMYQSLKLMYSMMRRENVLSSRIKNSDPSYDGIRQEVLEHLLQKERVVITKTSSDRKLSLSEVHLN